MPITTCHKEFMGLVGSLGHGHQTWRLFADFCEMSALALVNAIEKREDRERQYLDIAGRYQPKELDTFARMLAVTTQALADLECDFLGEMFMSLDLGSHWHGQFFTPMPICRAMGDMSLVGLEEKIQEQGFIMVSEPASGAGAMILALAAAMRSKGYNPQSQMHVTAVDVDATAAHMCFVQLALTGIPAAVYRGNTISMEMHDCFLTPFHHLGLWGHKLRRHHERQQEQQAPAQETVALQAPPTAQPASLAAKTKPKAKGKAGRAKQPDLFEAAL